MEAPDFESGGAEIFGGSPRLLVGWSGDFGGSPRLKSGASTESLAP